MIEIIKNKQYRIDMNENRNCLKLTFLSSHFKFVDAQRLIKHLERVLEIGIDFLDVEISNERDKDQVE